jgi:hypothetical protein
MLHLLLPIAVVISGLAFLSAALASIKLPYRTFPSNVAFDILPSLAQASRLCLKQTHH